MGTKGPVGIETVMRRNRTRTTRQSEPRQPKGLSPEAAREWKRVTGLLRSRNALDGLDQTALHDYLVCWQRLTECEAEISKFGVMVAGANDRGRVKNPAIQIARTYRDALVTWSREIGLTFASRTRLAIEEQKNPTENKFAQLAAESQRVNR